MKPSIRRVLFTLLTGGGLSVAFAVHSFFSPARSVAPIAVTVVSATALPSKAGAVVPILPASLNSDSTSLELQIDQALVENARSFDTERRLPALVLAWAETDFTAFSEYLRAHRERAPLLVETLASAAASARPTSALSGLLSGLAPLHQDLFTTIAARTLASKNSQVAADWVALPEVFPASAPAVDYVAGELAANHPELLHVWLAGLPTHLNASSAYAGAYRQLAADSPDRAIDALVAFAEKPGVNPDYVSAATRGVVEMIASDDPDLAADLSRRLTNAKDQALALHHALAHQDKRGDLQLP